jgi:hypothetical protein
MIEKAIHESHELSLNDLAFVRVVSWIVMAAETPPCYLISSEE